MADASDLYPSRPERRADGWVHGVGVTAAAVGGAVLLGVAAYHGGPGRTAAIAVYAACLIAMLAVSAAYNLSGPRRRAVLRRLDHAAIFLMIAGSYTPFTTQRLHGGWAFGMTAAVWGIAAAAAAGKLFGRGLHRGAWVVLYLALGWLVVVAVQPLVAGVSPVALILLLAGGLIYTAGVVVYLRQSLPFRRAIWHGFVLAAAATHYAAILTGVALA
ncbi:MAG: hemolysin III family protein [Caulobacteraceae bacterium]|nr:hemolysin III family protein [Caulobacteraceae bacterium]